MIIAPAADQKGPDKIAETFGPARAVPILLAAFVACCAAGAAWMVHAPWAGGREPDRTYAIWHASSALTAYDRLAQGIATSPGGTQNGALAEAFAKAVARLHESDQAGSIEADPTLGALVHRLDADRDRLPEMTHPDTTAAVPDDTTELARLTEVVNQAGAIQAEQDKTAANRRGWQITGLIAALAGVTLLLIGVLERILRDLRATRYDLEETSGRLTEALAAAGRSDDAASRFISTASHDLRAPMDAVMSLTDSLLEERLPPMQREITSRIRDAGNNMLRALDDVVDYRTLESGDLALDERPFSPEAVTAAAVIGIEAQARAKGLTIVAIPSPGLPKLLLGDAERVGRILSRLAANAIRFTAKGGVTLQVLCVNRSLTQVSIEWVTTDTGAGIDPARLDRLFEPRPNEFAGRRMSDLGGGLGLVVCKRLITRMGGGITVESTVGEGSRFRVRLPFRVAPGGIAAAKSAPSPSAALLREQLRTMARRPRLLMAEDTPAGQFILRQLLAREGIAPDMVGDGRAAVKAAEAERYDVICLDLRMPDIDGLEAARRIRSGRGPSANSPIIAVTASNSAADMQACEAAGITMFITKPVRRETLLNALLSALTSQAATAAEEPPVARQAAR